MARTRYLKIGFFKNERLAEFGPWHRLLFEGLWLLADRAGRLEDRPKRIKAELFPYDMVEVNTMLDDLADGDDPFIVRYEVAGARYIQVVNFLTHQSPHHREGESIIPNHDKSLVKTPSLGISEAQTDQGKAQPPFNGEWGMGNGEGTDSAEPSADASAPPDALLVFPVIGKGAKTWSLMAAYVAELAGDYPGLDVLGECRSARAWCVANPNKRKTAKGMPAFIVNWLNRAVKDGGARRASSPQPSTSRVELGAWRDECQREHGGRCTNQHFHLAMMQPSQVSA